MPISIGSDGPRITMHAWFSKLRYTYYNMEEKLQLTR